MSPRSRAVSAVLGLASSLLACSSAPPNQAPDAGDAGDARPPDDMPYLTALSVSSSADASSISLVPQFSPEIHDYYVRCATGTNELQVTISAPHGSSGSLRSPVSSKPSAQQTNSLSVNEDQAIVAVATAGSATAEYWVRCLPHDFPQMSIILHPGAGTPPPGYYVLGGNNLLPNVRWGYAMVVDGHGVPVWYTHGARRGSRDWDVDSLSPGTISFFSQFGHAAEVHQLSPLKTTYAAPSGTALDSHELRFLPNGNYLVLADPTETGADLTGLRVGLPDGGVVALGKNANYSACDVVEFDPTTGAVAWRWLSSEHLDPVKDSTTPEASPQSDGGLIIEPFHCNSIDVDPTNRNLLVSSRNMDSIFYIERSTGAILWKIGGKSYTKDNATLVPVDDPFYRQHDARFQPGWSSTCSGGRGQISLFDDRSDDDLSHVPGPARGVLLDVLVGRDGGAAEDCGTGEAGSPGATVAWQYEGMSSSPGQGSFRVSADGSRVIGWGMNGTRGIVFTEVNEAGSDLVDFYFTDGNASYRVVKVPLTAFDLEVLRTTAGATSVP